MHTALIINSVLSVVGIILGVLFAGGSIVSIANMTISWTGVLIVAALLVPVAFLVSGIGAWLVYRPDAPQFAIGMIALPWIYGLIFVALMLVAFKQ